MLEAERRRVYSNRLFGAIGSAGTADEQGVGAELEVAGEEGTGEGHADSCSRTRCGPPAPVRGEELWRRDEDHKLSLLLARIHLGKKRRSIVITLECAARECSSARRA